MKKFSVLLLIFILLCAVSCGTTKSNLGSEVVYEETAVVDSSDAFDDISSEVFPESSTDIDANTIEAQANEALVDASADVSTETEVVTDFEDAESVEAVEKGEPEVSGAEVEGTEVDEVATEALGDITFATETSESINDSEIFAEFAPATEATEPDVTIDVNEPIVIEVYEQEANKEASLTNAPSSFPQPPKAVEETVPTDFFDKVVYYAKLYGNKALDFAKNNILLSLGFLTIAIGLIMLLVDLIKYIAKSIRANHYSDDDDYYDDFEIEEPEITKEDLYHPVKSAKKAAKAAKAEAEEASDDKKFQSEDDFLRSLLNDEDQFLDFVVVA